MSGPGRHALPRKQPAATPTRRNTGKFLSTPGPMLAFSSTFAEGVEKYEQFESNCIAMARGAPLVVSLYRSTTVA